MLVNIAFSRNQIIDITPNISNNCLNINDVYSTTLHIQQTKNTFYSSDLPRLVKSWVIK